MLDPLLVPDIDKLVAEARTGEACSFLLGLHPADAAEALERFSLESLAAFFRTAAPQGGASVFARLHRGLQLNLAAALDDADLAALSGALASESRAAFLKALPEERRLAVLGRLGPEERESYSRLSAYPEGSVGSIMTTDFLALGRERSVADALAGLRLRAAAGNKLREVFVVNGQGLLEGSIEPAALLAAAPETALACLLGPRPPSIHVRNETGAALRLVLKYGARDLPAVDADGRMLGLARNEDIVASAEAQRSREEEREAAIAARVQTSPYLNGSVWSAFSGRAGWLIALALAGLWAGNILQANRGLLTGIVALALYLPLLAGAGGNAAGQAASAVLRSILVRELGPRNGFAVLWKETRVGLLLAALLALLAFARVLVWGGSETGRALTNLDLGLVIGISLALQVFLSTLLGALLPLGAEAVGLDPFLVSSPLLAALADILGLSILFAAAKLALGIF